MLRIMAAMEREAEEISKRIEGIHVDVIGIGAVNIPETSDEDIIINVGYAGGSHVYVNAIVEPLFALDYKTGAGGQIDQIFEWCTHCRCYTSDEFVTSPATNLPSIYDMELERLLHIPHAKLYALKIVSDNLNESDCEAYIGENAWDIVARTIKNYFKG